LRVLVTFALENEFAPWRALHRFRRSTWGAAEAYFAEIGAAEVSVVLTGAGPRQAALQASKVTWGGSDSVEVCISSGLAGALKPQYQIGQVLAARAVMAESAPERATSGILDSSAALVSFAEEYGATAVDRFYSAERVVARAQEKRHLGGSADAVEMESFQILLKARAEGIPAVAIRAISDDVDEDLPLDMNEIFNAEGEVSVPRVLGQVALRPKSLPSLVRLGRRSKRAAESLALFLDRYIVALSEKAHALETRVWAAPQPQVKR
jgi:adenosylhomocysteine nucleosidase